ncbi:GDSL-type esterase/lipase family protein [Spirillospora sp. NPDC048911]|uniref:GDSL-type esterase/lipase family protein n=1 Tax=Spirillospora sp. NPDC048911 TaxID=3364527 RepID=UPI003715B240
MGQRSGPWKHLIGRSAQGRLACLVALSIAPLSPPTAHASTTSEGTAGAPTGVPVRMAALGDSITRGRNACLLPRDCVKRSWSTGRSPEIKSHYRRLKARRGRLAAYNDAVSGAQVSALARQAASAVAQRAQYVTILIGANDACARSEAAMTPVDDYRTAFRTAMETLRRGVPHARIFVASIPDLKRMWQVGKDRSAARTVWTLFHICQSMLADPLSMATADQARRDRVRRRVIDYNAVMAQVCAKHPTCRFDGNAVFNYRFTRSQMSRWDHFHPNLNGQATLARVTYRRSFWADDRGRPASES